MGRTFIAEIRACFYEVIGFYRVRGQLLKRIVQKKKRSVYTSYQNIVAHGLISQLTCRFIRRLLLLLLLLL